MSTTMYAVIRESTLRSGAQEQLNTGRNAFAALRAQQPGYQGSVVIDAGNGRMLTIGFWESEQSEQAARAILQPQAERLMTPHLTASPQVTAQGQVVANELTTR